MWSRQSVSGHRLATACQEASRYCDYNDAGYGNGIVVGKGGSRIKGVALIRGSQRQFENRQGATANPR